MNVFCFRDFLLSAFFAVIICADKVSYRDVHVFRIDAKNQKELDKVKSIRNAYPTDHIWRSASSASPEGQLVHLAYSKRQVREVSDALNHLKLRHNIVIRDLQAVIDRQDRETASVPSRLKRGADCKCCNESMLADFMSYNDVMEWLKYLVQCKSKDKSLNLRTFDFGKTYENRPLRGIEIGAPADGAKAKPVIWLHANEHAREWLAGSTAIYIINSLVNDKEYKDLVHGIHWLIVPIENPDGYEYTRSTDRLWRKNRNPEYGLKKDKSGGKCQGDDCKTGEHCVGVDLNRNWDAKWSRHVDTSENPCEYQVYDGPHAFSEPESAGARDKINEHISNMGAFFSLHTYGQLWLVPYSFSGTEKPDDIDEVQSVAEEGARKIMDLSGSNWTTGPSPNILYAVSGSGMDWAKLNGVKYSYTLELPPKDDKSNDGSAFVPSKSEIVPAGDQVIAGIKYVAIQVMKEWAEKHPNDIHFKALVRRMDDDATREN